MNSAIGSSGLELHPSEFTLPSRSQHLPFESLGKEGNELTDVSIGRIEVPFR